MSKPFNYAVATGFLVLMMAVLSTLTAHRDLALAFSWLVTNLGLPILVYCWCKVDSRKYGISPPPGAIPMLAVMLPIGWIYYIVATRSPGRASIAIGVVLLFAFGLGALVTLVQ